MIITFLGTGTSQGVPVIACDCEVCQSPDFRNKRTRSAIHIQTEELSLVVDTGPDFRQQMLRERIKHVDAILFTHEHKDHTAGMDDIRSYNFIQHSDMPIYARKSVIQQLKKEFSYVFEGSQYPGIPRVKTTEITNKPFSVEGLDVIPIEVKHHHLPVFGFRIGDFTYITDANHIDHEEILKVKGSKVVVLNALQKEHHVSHFTLDEAIELAQEIGAEETYFTHISHKLGLHRHVAKELPDGIHLSYDGLQIHL